MRRPRSKLQVSMFPFLAVLLCVMGALLLILFMMDRRAKIVAQHQISEMKSARLARSKADEEARKAEWEKAKQALHLSLLAQQDELKADAKDLQSNLNDANKKLENAKLTDAELKKKMQDEAEKIALLQVHITTQQNGVTEAAKNEKVSKAELLDAAKELADLEFAFKKLRALKQNDKQTYSLVPYRGKHGDMRPPIYVECVGAGVLFHPEKDLLAGPSFTIANVRSEVERRAGPLVVEKSVSKSKLHASPVARTAPYVLFLVRPDGIENYYQAQSYLKGYQLDFGYELVDQHWALDFGAIPQPIHTANANGSPNPFPPGVPNSRATSLVKGGSGGSAGAGGSDPIGPPTNFNQPPGTVAGTIGAPYAGAGPFGAGTNPNQTPGTGVGAGGSPFGTPGGSYGSGANPNQLPGTGFGGAAPRDGPFLANLKTNPPARTALFGGGGLPFGPSFGSYGARPFSLQSSAAGFATGAPPFGTGSDQFGPRPYANQPSGPALASGSPSYNMGNGPFGSPGQSPNAMPGNPAPPFSIRPPVDDKGNGVSLSGARPTIGNPTYNGISTGIPVNGASFVPFTKTGSSPIPIATTGDSANLGNRPPNPNGGAAGNSPGSGTMPVNPMADNGNGPAIGNPAANPIASTGNPMAPGNRPPNPNDPSGNPANPLNAAASGGPSTNAPYAGQGGGSPQGAGNSDGGSGEEPSAAPPFRPLPTYGAAPLPRKKSSPPPPIGRVLGNKDFLITIDCYSDRVSVFPGGLTFRWTATNQKATDQALVQSISNLIAKRQASVRPGEPPYRPIIRFQVTAEGLRSYYQAYPLLEPLGVAMQRENIDE